MRFRIEKRIFFKLFFIFLGLCVYSQALAADLVIIPSTLNVSNNETFDVNLVVNSADQSINAVSANINYPTTHLQVVDIIYDTSLVNFWVEKPTYSNSFGSIKIEGVILSPGFIGMNGQIAKIRFKSLAPGLSRIDLISGSVLSNDGNGTNVLQKLVDGSIHSSINTPLSISVPETTFESTIKISSPTHPEEDEWYNNSAPKFVWSNNQSIKSVRLSISDNPVSSPKTIYEPAISEIEFSAVAEGKNYFYLQQRDSSGIWGPINRFGFNIDLTQPIVSLKPIEADSDSLIQRTFSIEVSDEISGVGYYEIYIDDKLKEKVESGVLRNFDVTGMTKGEHLIQVIAYDKAGNSSQETAEFFVETSSAMALTQLDDREYFILTKDAIGTLVIVGLLLLVLIAVFGTLIWKKSRHKILALLTNKIAEDSDEFIEEELEEIKHSAGVYKKVLKTLSGYTDDPSKQDKIQKAIRELNDIDEEDPIIKDNKRKFR